MTNLDVTEWTLAGALDEMKRINDTMKDRQFAFILGAGASFTSGIPTGQILAQRWLKDLHLRECADGRSLEQWMTGCGVGKDELTWETAAEHYSQIFERRFDGDREAGYAELEAAMEGKTPSFGYSLLAEIIQNTRHKVVVTTNFDNLVVDALAIHAHQSPLVVAHESLAGFVRPQLRRPLVAKIHRDLYLNPINDVAGVSTMEQGWKIALKKLFQYFTPVVVGYGGNDGSLMDMLTGLDPDDIAGRMIWCYREGSRPPEKVLSMLKKHRGLLVKIQDFDQFMLQLADKLVPDFNVAAIAERTGKLGQERADRYRDQAGKLSEWFARGSPAEQKTSEVLTQSVRTDQSWWAWVLKANAEPDNEKSRLILLEGIELFPNSAELADAYANFMHSKMKDFDVAEEFYKKSIALNPKFAASIGRYASFLAGRREDYDGAESMYKRALETDPNHAHTMANYARFLIDHRNNTRLAATMYKKAFEIEPNNPWVNCTYANFLAQQNHDSNAVESMYKRAIEHDPNNIWYITNYAIFLAEKVKNYDEAELTFKRALENDPENAWIKGAHKRFLDSKDITK